MSRISSYLAAFQIALSILKNEETQAMQCEVCKSINIKKINSVMYKNHYVGFYRCSNCGAKCCERQIWRKK